MDFTAFGLEFTNLIYNDGNSETIDFQGNYNIVFVLGCEINPNFVGDSEKWSIETKHYFEGNFYTADKGTSLTTLS